MTITELADHQDWRPRDTLAARLVLMRRELGLSQREAAEKCGIVSSAIRKFLERYSK